MRVFLGLAASAVAILAFAGAFSGCGDDGEPIHAVCKDFCEGLVSAMDDSDGFDMHNKSEAEKECMHECTDSIEGVKDNDLQDDIEDCVDCIGNETGDGADWDDFIDAYTEDCVDECYDDDYPDDPNPWDEFYSDFMEDFSEHYSNGEGGGDSDIDGDSDSDSDCDLGAYEDCGTDYADCYALCEDQQCYDDCLLDFCDCAYLAGCEEYVSDIC